MDPFPVLLPELQVSFHFKLKLIRDAFFHDSLSKTVASLSIKNLDLELARFVPEKSLQKLASFSIRGEAVFPVPLVLSANPFLLGYYRLLFGFSQKEFYAKGPFGLFKNMEEKGRLSLKAESELENLCISLAHTGAFLVSELDIITIQSLQDLQLLTVGPQFRGAKNNEYGQIATRKTFEIIRAIVKPYIQSTSPNSIEIQNTSNRIVLVAFASDPDIQITEQMPTRLRPLISIEIKGGKDFSNIHNRIGEAEKSHQKAKNQGFFEFMTIVSVDVAYHNLAKESPTTTHFFNLDKIADMSSNEYERFREILASIIGIRL